jgi:hypothetical protein
MATALDLQYAASQVQHFRDRVTMAMLAAAQSITAEAPDWFLLTPLGTVAVTNLSCSPLPVALAVSDVVMVGYRSGFPEGFVVSAAAAINAVTIAVTSKVPANAHQPGERCVKAVLYHDARANLALQVANGPDRFRPLFAGMLAAQGIEDTSTDTAISNMVSAVWNAVAGVV